MGYSGNRRETRQENREASSDVKQCFEIARSVDDAHHFDAVFQRAIENQIAAKALDGLET